MQNNYYVHKSLLKHNTYDWLFQTYKAESKIVGTKIWLSNIGVVSSWTKIWTKSVVFHSTIITIVFLLLTFRPRALTFNLYLPSEIV